jgi:hypothetical protein
MSAKKDGLKKVVFYVPEMEHALFRIQLKYDNMVQGAFFHMILRDYTNKHPELMKYVYDRINTKGNGTRLKKIREDQKEAKQTIEDFGLNEEEIKNIFDIIASEDPDL